MVDFSYALEALSDDIWDERPVDLHTFLYDKEFMALPQLSPIQEEIVSLGSNVYFESTWTELYGAAEGKRLAKMNKKEMFFILGKGCHSPDTPIYNPQTGRWQRLDSFLDPDNKVVGVHDGENKLVEQYATESFLEGFGDMVRVTTQLGFVEDVHVGHKYLSMAKHKFYKRKRDGNSGHFTRVDELKVGDRVAIPLGLPMNNPTGHDLNEVTLVAYWIGDGCIPDRKVGTCLNVDFGEHEADSLKRYTDACDALGASYSVRKHPNKKMFMVQHNGLLSNNKVLGDILDKYAMWGARAGNKKIPDPIWQLSNADLAYFIGCLWSTDGCVYLKKRGDLDSPVAEYCSISLELAHGLQKALLRIGAPSSIRSRIPKYTYKGERKAGQRAYYLTISSADLFIKFADTVGRHLMDIKASKVAECLGLVDSITQGYARSDGEIYWDQIKKIEPLPPAEFWTLTAPETHSYVGNGMVSAQSGKDLLSTIICARIVYFLLCLKDPAKYYGKPAGDNIDIVNVAKNAKQASNVFFAGLKTRIKKCKWFSGRYKDRSLDIEFDKNIRIHSLNSENEGTEGLNILVAVLDEIDSFDEGIETPNADEMYKTLRATVSSRFDKTGKVLALSFPRSKKGFIMRKYKEFVREKETVKYSHTFRLNPELGEGVEGNEFTVEWEEDEITSYNYSNVWALRRPTWRVNPTKSVDSFTMDFYADTADALGRFAADPQETDGKNDWYRDKAKIDATFTEPNGVLPDGSIRIKPDPDKTYFIHADLALKQDNAAIALAHVDSYKSFQIGSTILDPAPHVVVDLVRYWKPGPERPLDFSDIRGFIVSLRRMGFDIQLVTFDRWNSDQIMDTLFSVGIDSEKLSVGRDHYSELALIMGEDRLKGPDSTKLIDELKTLIVNDKGKVDHPGRTGNDLADAVCGAVWNASVHTEMPEEEAEIVTYADVRNRRRAEELAKFQEEIASGPGEKMPMELKDFLSQVKLL